MTIPKSKDCTVRVETLAPQSEVEKRIIVGEAVGAGGTCEVQEAKDTNLLRSVARKVLHAENACNEALCGKLIEEAQITAQLDHPNIVPVYELGIDPDKQLYFTMKLVRGSTFTDILAEKEPGKRSASELFGFLQIFLKVCDAVSFAHSRGVVHQDLKPDNIMVGEFGEVYLMDWGFAKLNEPSPPPPPTKDGSKRTSKKKRRRYSSAAPGMITTTIQYMAPEHKLGEQTKINEQTDIFCLGGILYKILTGKPPFYGETIQQAAQKAMTGQLLHPVEVVGYDLPQRLVRICMKALSPDPSDRYQSANELKEDLENFLQCGWQFDRKLFEKGDVIIQEGDKGDEGFIITSGSCRVFKTVDDKEVELGQMTVGDVFGELAVFSKQRRAASVVALEPVSAMVISRENFEQDLGMSFWLGLFVKAMSDRFLEGSKKITELEREIERLKSNQNLGQK